MSSISPIGIFTADRGQTRLRMDAPARGAAIEFRFEGRTIGAYEGESIACALFAAGVRTLRMSPRTEAARGMFCLMGSCQECIVMIDGERLAACQAPARAGLDVKSGTIERNR